jgi:A/G-specific adenine glycosylase
MLQQTRVETVIPYFNKWMNLFPSVQALADARQRAVLNAWEGLGYYSRVRNLHKAAKIIVQKHQGAIPTDVKDLLALPGIGRYTAGAIASIAFGLDEPILDGNVKRVYSRLLNSNVAVDSTHGEKLLWEVAKEHLPNGKAGEFNQGLMDLGAMICIPKVPRCSICPIRVHCIAYKNRVQAFRPILKQKRSMPRFVQVSAVVIKNGKALLCQRPSKGLLGGMWEFPNGRVNGDPAHELNKTLKSGYGLRVQKREAMGIVQHSYTHFKVTVYIFRCGLISILGKRNLKWVAVNQLEKYPMGKIDRQIANLIKQ